jgi:hypothetical protein
VSCAQKKCEEQRQKTNVKERDYRKRMGESAASDIVERIGADIVHY